MGRHLECCGKKYRKPEKRRVDNYKDFKFIHAFYVQSCDKCQAYLIGYIGFEKKEGETRTLPRFPESGLYQYRGNERYEFGHHVAAYGYNAIELQDNAKTSGTSTKGGPVTCEWNDRADDPFYILGLEKKRAIPAASSRDAESLFSGGHRRPVAVI